MSEYSDMHHVGTKLRWWLLPARRRFDAIDSCNSNGYDWDRIMSGVHVKPHEWTNSDGEVRAHCANKRRKR